MFGSPTLAQYLSMGSDDEKSDTDEATINSKIKALVEDEDDLDDGSQSDASSKDVPLTHCLSLSQRYLMYLSALITPSCAAIARQASSSIFASKSLLGPPPPPSPTSRDATGVRSGQRSWRHAWKALELDMMLENDEELQATKPTCLTGSESGGEQLQNNDWCQLQWVLHEITNRFDPQAEFPSDLSFWAVVVLSVWKGTMPHLVEAHHSLFQKCSDAPILPNPSPLREEWYLDTLCDTIMGTVYQDEDVVDDYSK